MIDLWLVLVRRRWWFVGTLLVVMSVVVALLMLTPSLYQSRAVIRIGQIANVNGSGQTTLLESPDVLASKLRSAPHVTDVEPSGNGALVTVAAQGHSPKQAQGFLASALRNIQNDLQQRFDQAMSRSRSYKASLNGQLGELQSINQQLAKAANSGQKTASTLTASRVDLLQQIGEIQTHIANVQQSMTPPQSIPTELIQKPNLPAKRTSPNVKLMVVLGLLAGIVLGVFTAFSIEFLHRARMEMQWRRAEEDA